MTHTTSGVPELGAWSLKLGGRFFVADVLRVFVVFGRLRNRLVAAQFFCSLEDGDAGCGLSDRSQSWARGQWFSDRSQSWARGQYCWANSMATSSRGLRPLPRNIGKRGVLSRRFLWRSPALEGTEGNARFLLFGGRTVFWANCEVVAFQGTRKNRA